MSRDEQPRTGLKDLIEAKQSDLEKLNDKIANYEDPSWLLERKQKLVDKRDIIEQELSILMGAQSQLKSAVN